MTNQLQTRTQPLFLKSYTRFKADIRIATGRDEFLSGSQGGKKFRKEAWYRLIVLTIISFVLLVAGLYILLSPRFGEDIKKIGSGFIGTVVGYWLA